jgi:hypothetical protein
MSLLIHSKICSGSVLWRAATIKIGSGRHIYRTSHNKVHKDAEIRSFKFKGPRPFKIKKKCSAEQWEIISYPLIPLLTHVSSCCTVPLIHFIVAWLVIAAASTNYVSHNGYHTGRLRHKPLL